MTPALVLAQSNQAPANALGPLLLWVGLGVVLAIAAGIILVVIRKRALDRNALADQGTMLDQIRAMRDRGEISTEEFNAIRATLIAKAKASLETQDQHKPLPAGKLPRNAPSDPTPGAESKTPPRNSPPL